MEIKFTFDKEAGEIDSKCPESVSDEDIRNYFNAILEKKDEIKEAHEIADLTEIKEFRSTAESFYQVVSLYETIAKEIIIIKIGILTPNTTKQCQMSNITNEKIRSNFAFSILQFAFSNSPINNTTNYYP